MDCDALKAWQQALLSELTTDSLAPFGSYSIDGQSVSRESWTRFRFDTLSRLNDLIQMCEPFEIRTHAT